MAGFYPPHADYFTTSTMQHVCLHAGSHATLLCHTIVHHHYCHATLYFQNMHHTCTTTHSSSLDCYFILDLGLWQALLTLTRAQMWVLYNFAADRTALLFW